MYSGNHIELRALKPSDLPFLYQVENHPEHWKYSDIPGPYSKEDLMALIEESIHGSIYESFQERFVIEEKNQNPVGFIDLYDFDFTNKRAGVGVLVVPEYRRKGYAKEALLLLETYAKIDLKLHQLYALISEDNLKSRALFEENNYIKTSEKKDWYWAEGQFKNAFFYQKKL